METMSAKVASLKEQAAAKEKIASGSLFETDDPDKNEHKVCAICFQPALTSSTFFGPFCSTTALPLLASIYTRTFALGVTGGGSRMRLQR